MSRIEVQEPDDRPAGHALIRVGGGARAGSDPRFRLRRSAEWGASTLGPAGWQVADTLLQPASVTVEGDDLVLIVGPSVCVHVESGVYEVSVPAAGAEGPVLWPDIATPVVSAPPPPPSPPPPPAHTTQADIPPPPTVKPVEEEGDTPPPPPKRPVWLFAIFALLVLGGAGVAAYLFIPRPAPVPVVAVPPLPPPGPALDRMSAADLIARGNPDEMFNEAQRRIALPPPGPSDAMLLLEAAGDDRHHAQSLGALAQLYDPNKLRRGGVPEDALQAAKYYQLATKAGQSDLAADRAALRSLLESRKAAGNLDASVILEDFWP